MSIMNDKQKNGINDPSREAYEAIGVDQLLTYCVKQVLNNKEECTLERLIYECYTRFPKKFSLSRYPQWPDSTRIYRSWRRCQGVNKWLTGSAQEGFRITNKGEPIVQEISLKLQDPKSKNVPLRESTRSRGKEEAIVRYLRKSGTFVRWHQEKNLFKISESELRSVLNATLETSIQILVENITYYRDNAELINDTEVIEFLNECCRQHQLILGRLQND